MPTAVDPERLALVARSARAWSTELIELNHRNSLVNFKRPKTASLELTGCPPEALAKALHGGSSVQLRTLFPDDDEFREACNRARQLSRKITGFREEQGTEVGQIASGLVRVRATGSTRSTGVRPPVPLRAPVLLRSVSLTARTTTESDFSVQAGTEVELNPVLPHALHREYGLSMGPDELDSLLAEINTEINELGDSAEQLDRAYEVLRDVATGHRIELELERATVIGLFNYQKMPMARDLESATELLAGHDLVAALANCPAAEKSVQDSSTGYSPPPIDSIAPDREYLAQDADSSQQQAIETVLAGHHLLIEGPPGTGKSQTIANIIVGAAAQGKRVLFVAEKRAAIEAVTERLAAADLGDLVLDLHGGSSDKKQVAVQLAESLARVSQQPPVDADDVLRGFADRRERLAAYSREWSQPHEPWGLSDAQVCEKLLVLGEENRTRTTIRGRRLEALDARTIERAEEDIRRFVEVGGLRILRRESPWWRAEVERDDLAPLLAELDELTGTTLRRGEDGMSRLLGQVGLPVPGDISGWGETLTLLDGVTASVRTFGPEVFGDRLDTLWLATAPRQERVGVTPTLSWWARWKVTGEARRLCATGLTRRADLHTALTDTVGQRAQWRKLGGATSQPVPAAGLDEVSANYRTLRTQLAAVALSSKVSDLADRPTRDMEAELRALRDDEATLWKLPDITRLRRELDAWGLGELLAELAERDPSAEQAGVMFRHAWLRGLHEEFRLRSPNLSAFTPEQHDRLVREFQQADRAHRDATAQRVRRKVAVRVRQVSDEYPEQTKILRREAAKIRRLMPMRRLVEQTADVLLTLRPCWAMSPLVVSQMLPAAQLFDLVIFDEASQIKPHDAITSIMRGKRLVVAGDEHQLPPSSFFDRQLAGADHEGDEDDDLGDYESVLGSLRAVIPNRRLRWHYRSQDERLIAFCNDQIYDNDLVTFPGARQENPVRLEVVAGTVSPGTGGLPEEEVRRVVELVLEHAERSPELSLGVITLGSKHQDRVDKAIREARVDRRDLDDFFAGDAGPTRRFFVKNIETVQGDERDAIILSVGVGVSASGTVNRTAFGPLNREVGKRRLNVALTRAKRRLTVVSSFRSNALQPWSPVNGTELLRRFLETAERATDPAEVGRSTGAALNGFERDILHRLTDAGVTVYPQWGVSNYAIDFALAHPTVPGQMVLAVEADGDTYHRGASARDRDRLRQEHLERLGWSFHRVWASAWFADPEREARRIVDAWLDAVTVWDERQRTGPPRAPIPPSTPAPRPAGRNRGPRPDVWPGRKILEYAEHELIDLCVWLMRDGLALDSDQRLKQAMAELGFRAKGRLIVQELTSAIRIAQRHTDRSES